MSGSRARTGFLTLAIVVVAAILGWYYAGRERGAPSGTESPVATLPAETRPPAPASPDAPSARAGNQPEAPAPSSRPTGGPKEAPGQQGAAARAPAGDKADQPPAASADDARRPSFDVVRVEPSGESVIAGRAVPGATIDLLSDGQSLARVVADTSGLFAIVPPALSPGTHEISLQAIAPDGTRLRSAQSVTVAIAPNRDRKPLVTVTIPDQPTVVLSRPDEPAAVASADIGARPGPSAVAPAAPGQGTPPSGPTTPGPATPAARATPPASARPPIKIASVESLGTGRLFVSGQGAPNATVRLYLNDSFVAPGAAGGDGRLSFSIERGVRPGEYRVRLDDVDPSSGAVRSRAEVPFSMPQAAVATVTPQEPPASRSGPAGGVGASAGPSASGPAPAAGTGPSAGSAAPAPAGGQPGGSTSTTPGTEPVPASRTEVARAPAALPRPGENPPGTPSAPVASTAVPSGATPSSATPSSATPSVAAPNGAVATAPPGTPSPGAGGERPASSSRTASSDRSVADATAGRAGEPGRVVVPEVNTALVVRGDNLWRISKKTYGEGLRYTVIYDANSPQIRDPDLIYPGQVFVLPNAPEPARPK